jgi:hypothetical protein
MGMWGGERTGVGEIVAEVTGMVRWVVVVVGAGLRRRGLAGRMVYDDGRGKRCGAALDEAQILLGVGMA